MGHRGKMGIFNGGWGAEVGWVRVMATGIMAVLGSVLRLLNVETVQISGILFVPQSPPLWLMLSRVIRDKMSFRSLDVVPSATARVQRNRGIGT